MYQGRLWYLLHEVITGNANVQTSYSHRTATVIGCHSDTLNTALDLLVAGIREKDSYIHGLNSTENLCGQVQAFSKAFFLPIPLQFEFVKRVQTLVALKTGMKKT
jgi:hypothetical protein